MSERDLLQQAVNEIKTRADYRSVCFLVQNRIQAGAELDSDLLTSLAVKGHTLTTDPLSGSFLSAWQAEAKVKRGSGDNGGNSQWGGEST